MILKKPFPLVLMKAAIRKVTTATRAFFQSPPSTKPAFLTADPASPRPMTMIIGPMTTAGSNLSIQRVPATLTPAATST